LFNFCSFLQIFAAQLAQMVRKLAILFGTLFAISGFVAAQSRFQAVTHEQAVIRH